MIVEAVITILVSKLNFWIYILLMMLGLYAMIAKKNLVKNWWSTLTYTYCWNREKRDGGWKKYLYSIPHYGNLIVGYDLNRNYTASARFSASTGMPYTPQTIANAPRFSKRADTYHRIDLRFDYRESFRKMSLTLFIEISNLMGTSNKFVRSEGDYGEGGWGFFPVGGLQLAF